MSWLPKRESQYYWRLSTLLRIASLITPLLVQSGYTGSTAVKERKLPLVIYSGRSEELIGPLIKRFEREYDCQVKVRYGNSAEMAALILEEGRRSPASVFFSQDAGALGALASAGHLNLLPETVLSKVNKRFRSKTGLWVGTSGRARVVVYNTKRLKESDLPNNMAGFCDPKWNRRIGWAPTNGSFQAYITALRMAAGETQAREWLSCIQKNHPKIYPKNAPIVAAVGSGEIDVGFVNHYYLYRFIKEFGENFSARNHFIPIGKLGGLINVAGAGVIRYTEDKDLAVKFINFLLTLESQQYFADRTFEYALSAEVTSNPLLTPLNNFITSDIDLSKLDDLKGTLALLQDVGVL